MRKVILLVSLLFLSNVENVDAMYRKSMKKMHMRRNSQRGKSFHRLSRKKQRRRVRSKKQARRDLQKRILDSRKLNLQPKPLRISSFTPRSDLSFSSKKSFLANVLLFYFILLQILSNQQVLGSQQGSCGFLQLRENDYRDVDCLDVLYPKNRLCLLQQHRQRFGLPSVSYEIKDCSFYGSPLPGECLGFDLPNCDALQDTVEALLCKLEISNIRKEWLVFDSELMAAIVKNMKRNGRFSQEEEYREIDGQRTKCVKYTSGIFHDGTASFFEFCLQPKGRV